MPHAREYPAPAPKATAAAPEKSVPPGPASSEQDDDDDRFAIEFDPVPRRNRIDGWSPERQRDLVSAYAECGCITEACERVGKSRASYYTLERAPHAGDFRRAMAAAAEHSNRRMEDSARSRAIHGVTIPHYYKGELVGTHQRYNDRLIMFMLQRRMPEKNGSEAERKQAAEAPADTSELKVLELEQLTRKVEKTMHDRQIRDIPFALEIEQDQDDFIAILGQEEYQRQVNKIMARQAKPGARPPDVMSTLSTSAAFAPAMMGAGRGSAAPLPG